MSPSAEFDIGSEVACSDGVCGVLSRVVVDPVSREDVRDLPAVDATHPLA